MVLLLVGLEVENDHVTGCCTSVVCAIDGAVGRLEIL
jgi:hypothetical protein